MSTVRFCRCDHPARDVDADGIPYCSGCGELVPEGPNVLLPVVAAKIAQIERQVNGNGNGHKEPRLTLNREEAAESLGVSVKFLREHILPELRVIRRGRRVLVPVKELDRWVASEAEMTLNR